VKVRIPLAASRRLFASDQNSRASDDDAHGAEINPGQVHRNLKPVVSLVNVQCRRAFPNQRFGAELSTELAKDLLHIVRKLTDLSRERDGLEP
jgi:hypothetical protein